LAFTHQFSNNERIINISIEIAKQTESAKHQTTTQAERISAALETDSTLNSFTRAS